MRRRDIEVGKLYVVQRSRFGERLWRMGWWAAHVPSGTLQTLIAGLTIGIVSPAKGAEPPSGTIVRAKEKTKILGVTFVDPASGELVQISPQYVVPYEERNTEVR